MPAVVFMGTPEFAVPSLAALGAAGYRIAAVLTQPDRPAGRGRQVEASPVKRFAAEHDIPVLQPRTLRDEAVREELAALAPDLAVVAAYGLIIPQAVLDIPGGGCLNVHASLLPRGRGAAPITAAILAGDAQTGVSIMLMEAGLDTGPVLAQAAVPIPSDATTGSLSGKLAVLGAELLIETLPAWLDGVLKPVPQDEARATYAPRIGKEQGLIDWARPAIEIERQVRAYQPWPSAYTGWNGQRLKVLHAQVTRNGARTARLPGTVVAEAPGTAGVITGDGVLWLRELQLAGKRAMPVADFLRGAAGFVGSTLPS